MNRNLFLSSGVFVAASSALAACGGGLVASAPLLTSGRKPSYNQNGVPGGGGGGTQPTPNPIDPSSGLKIIGSVTAHMGPPIHGYMSFDWMPPSVTIPNALRNYVGAAWKLDQALFKCAVEDAVALSSTAAAVAAYLQANGKQLASATNDIIVFAQVYAAGGATALEFLGAVVAVLSILDWLALLTLIGATAVEVYHLMHCAIDQVAPP